MQHLKIIVKGRVQGVCFRAYTQKEANMLAIKGTVRNHRDGYVEIQAAGEEHNMQDFVQWCHKGSAFAKVSSVTLNPINAAPVYTDFSIID